MLQFSLLLLLLSSLAPTTGQEPQAVPAEQQAPAPKEHPVPLPADFDAAKCAECHTDKAEGKFVHSAVAMGCTTCHQVATENDVTKISLVAPVTELCTTCHEVNDEKSVHAPYKAGRCVMCHDPHTGEFPKVTRAETNTLCLSCHGVNQAGVKLDRTTQEVTFLGDRTMKLVDYRKAKRVYLNRSDSRGHPIMGHPVSGKDPRNPEATINCLSCHVPHSSPAVKLLLPEAESGDIGLCGKCHQ